MGVLKAWNGTAWEEIAVSGTGEFLPLAGGTMASNAVIQFPNEAAPTTKIVMYGTATSGFGMGVEGGNLTSFGSGFKFRQSSMTGTEWGSIDSSGVVSRGKRVMVARTTSVTLVVGTKNQVCRVSDNSWAGAARFTIAGKIGGATHIVTGVATTSGGLASITIMGNLSTGGKLWDLVSLDSGPGSCPYINVRAVRAGAATVSIEAMEMVPGTVSNSGMETGAGSQYTSVAI